MTKTRDRLRLGPHDTIRAAWSESVNGPGWSNRLVWVLVQCGEALRIEALQPDEQTEDMLMLFDVAECAHAGLRASVERACAIGTRNRR